MYIRAAGGGGAVALVPHMGTHACDCAIRRAHMARTVNGEYCARVVFPWRCLLPAVCVAWQARTTTSTCWSSRATGQAPWPRRCLTCRGCARSSPAAAARGGSARRPAAAACRWRSRWWRCCRRRCLPTPVRLRRRLPAPHGRAYMAIVRAGVLLIDCHAGALFQARCTSSA